MTDPDQRSASTAGDREELERMAERAAVLKTAELLAWCHERNAAREAAEHEATLPRREPAPVRRSQHQGAAEMSKTWENYIRRELDAQQRATMKAIAQVVVEEERARQALGDRVKVLEAEIAELRDRETARRLRAVPPCPPAAMIA